ncbi:lipid IV(A) 3-deoxy-D-manno-octulosonic acid transferase [Vibrio sinaloensis]|uniref:lipid IV(A) 3-deoxy-D-manno-octulosonic acid transferase n=1 Tax=Photobacterium sp. (strain ATCC 43367) TaxID=379097 RepID=UPI0020602DB1|nr:lipid IV(A) 3-deoxy-D-manno-octulosonic acid transferase [Vibrio sinaloensis]UPQ88095.1 lipid IV(A) 3-deoxy-D-manno-octulosonic acid transferase [Vibrio sinaloensis]
MIARAIYSTILTLVAPLLLYGLYKKKPGKPSVGKRWKEHFGFTPAIPNCQQPIWIHAASVGETLAVTPFIKQLKSRHADVSIVLTTTTPTGAEQAKRLGELVTHRYMPVDFSFAVERFIDVISPSQLIIVETELWPNTIKAVSQAGIPITLLNARLSEKSCRGYQKIAALFRPITQQLTKVLCQFHDDAQRFADLGVDKDKLIVTGSIKFDISVTDAVIDQGNQLRQELGTQRPLWIAASTHEGEDEQIFSAHQKLLSEIPNALLLIVPRHPERFQKVAALAKRLGFPTVTRSSGKSVSSDTQVYVGDTMGEMLTLMQASDVCFMGGSLIGKKVGGHNLLEPAALGKPILTGPSFYNFTDITHALVAADGCKISHNTEEIVTHLKVWLKDDLLRESTGQKALSVVQQNTGAIERSLAQIKVD